MTVFGGNIILASDLNEVYNASVARPICIVRNSAVQSVANNSVATALTWNTEDEDGDGWHSTSSNTSRITPLKAGWIQVTAVIHWAGNATGRRATLFKLNGAGTGYGEIKAATSASSVSTIAVREYEVNGTTDYLEVFGFQDSGGALNTADTANTFFSARWLRGS